jgi:hypothetical protein
MSAEKHLRAMLLKPLNAAMEPPEIVYFSG